MALLSYKLKAATLIESLVAMVIMVLFFGIATMVYLNVMNADQHRQKLKVTLLLDDLAHQTKASGSFFDQVLKTEEMQIVQSIIAYNNTENLSVLSIKAFDLKGKLLAERNELIVNK